MKNEKDIDSQQNLNGLQREQLDDALLSAFPTCSKLERMVKYRLNKNLSVIAGNGDLHDTVFRLTQWAEAEGRLEELVSGARKQNRQNPLLKKVAKDLGFACDDKPTRSLDVSQTIGQLVHQGWQGKLKNRHWVIIVIVCCILIALSPLISPLMDNINSSNGCAIISIPVQLPPRIGVATDACGENIGLSDGSYALDIGNERPGSDDKIKASEKLRNKDIGTATALWNTALSVDSNDAEAKIYLEDQRVLAYGKPYVTIVIGVLLADKPVDYSSRDQLQGAYLAQIEYNNTMQTSSSPLLRLLIAKSGNIYKNAGLVARQIVQAAQSDEKTIIGVLGWSKTTNSLDAIQVLAQAHIPMLSSSALGDALTDRSAYFFRVCPPNQQQEHVLVQYTEKNLKLDRLVAVYEDGDPFSQNMVDNFVQEFTTSRTNKKIPIKTYQHLSTPEVMKAFVNQVLLSMNPDAIILAGSRPSDVGNFLKAIPDSSKVKVLTDASAYSIVDAPPGEYGSTSRLVFVSPGFYKEWSKIKPTLQLSFFTEYKKQFDPNNQHSTTPYGYQRPDSGAMQAYDAALTLLQAIQMASATGKQKLTSDDLEQALLQIDKDHPVQGVSGQIWFGKDHDPVNKAILVLEGEQEDFQMKYYQGCFLMGDQDC